jgi:hypothetical protein
MPKKFYLICDSNQKTRGFRFALEKPEDFKTQGLAANMLRKHMPAAVLMAILLENATGDYWALFTSGRGAVPHWYIRVNREMPPDLSFMSADRDVFFRIGSAGSFSKRQTYPGPLPLPGSDGCVDLLEKLLSDLKVVETPGPDSVNSDEPPTLTTPATSNFPSYQREARDRLARRAKTIKKSLEKLRQQTPNLRAIEKQQQYAALLQQFSYLITDDSTELALPPEISGLPELVRIPLDEGISSGQQINDAFAKVKKMQKSLLLGGKKLGADERNFAAMENDLIRLRTTVLDQSTVDSILLSHRLSPEKQQLASKSASISIAKPCKEYQSSGEAKILVGKSAAESDEMVKSARSNDFWFHIIGTTGSHVIIPFKSVKGGQLADEAKREAGILAIHNSKLRTDLAGEVYFTRKQHLRKKRGMPPGLWTVDKSESFYIKYTEAELKKILDQFTI